MSFAVGNKYDINTDYRHLCAISVSRRDRKFLGLTRNELGELRYLGCDADCLSISAYKIAYIMGVHFRAGEWNQRPFCGSVVTCTLEGHSYYARVVTFLKVDDDECPGYALVRWFSKPVYPFDVPLVVRVGGDGRAVGTEFGSVIRITQIEPSRVIVEPALQADIFYMMRDAGYDRRGV